MSSRYAYFVPLDAQKKRSYFLDTPATSTLGTPASSRRTTVASG